MATVAHGKALVAKLRAQAGVRDPEALAAYLGRFKDARKAGMSPAKAKAAARGGATAGTPSKSPAKGKSAGDAKKRISGVVDKLQKDLPMVEISSVRPVGKDDDIPASAHMGHKSGVIVFNPNKMDAKGLAEVKEQQKQGFLVKTDADPEEYLATHEFGHSIPDAINKGASDPDTFEDYAEIQQAYAKVLRSDAKKSSLYSRTNRKEAFAEAYADYMLNPPNKQSPLAKEVGHLVQMLKKQGKKQ